MMPVFIQRAHPAGSLPPGLAGPWGLLPASGSVVPPGLCSAWAPALVLRHTQGQPSVWPPGSRCEPAIPRSVSTCPAKGCFSLPSLRAKHTSESVAPIAQGIEILFSSAAYFALGILHKQDARRRKEFPFSLKVATVLSVHRRGRKGGLCTRLGHQVCEKVWWG